MEKKGEEEKRLLEKIMLWLPGFKGYKEKEIRRESDKLLRSLLHQKMDSLRTRLFEVYRGIVDDGMTEMWEGIDRILARIDRLSERINHASYGYTGFFDLVKVDERKLDRMIEFDTQLFDTIEELSRKAVKMNEKLKEKDKEGIKKVIMSFSEDLMMFEEKLDERKNVILGVLEG